MLFPGHVRPGDYGDVLLSQRETVGDGLFRIQERVTDILGPDDAVRVVAEYVRQAVVGMIVGVCGQTDQGVDFRNVADPHINISGVSPFPGGEHPDQRDVEKEKAVQCDVDDGVSPLVVQVENPGELAQGGKAVGLLEEKVVADFHKPFAPELGAFDVPKNVEVARELLAKRFCLCVRLGGQPAGEECGRELCCEHQSEAGPSAYSRPSEDEEGQRETDREVRERSAQGRGCRLAAVEQSGHQVQMAFGEGMGQKFDAPVRHLCKFGDSCLSLKDVLLVLTQAGQPLGQPVAALAGDGAVYPVEQGILAEEVQVVGVLVLRVDVLAAIAKGGECTAESVNLVAADPLLGAEGVDA